MQKFSLLFAFVFLGAFCSQFLKSEAVTYTVGAIFPYDSSLNCNGPFPCSIPLFNIGSELNSAFRLACEEANRQFSVSNANITLNCISAPSTWSSGVSAAQQLVAAGAVAIVGEIRANITSDIVTYLQSLANPVPLISPVADAESLTVMPYFFRTVPPFSFQAYSVSDLLNFFNWSEVAIISSTDVYGVELSNKFVAECNRNRIRIVTHQKLGLFSDSNSVQQALINIRDSGASITYIATRWDTFQVFSSASNLGMVGKDWIWIGTQFTTGLAPGLVPNSIISSMQGTVAPAYRSGSGALYDSLKNLWKSKDPSQFPGQIWTTSNNPYSEPGASVAQTFDCLFAIQNALSYASQNNLNPAVGSQMRTSLLNVQFTGTTGPVRFDANGNPSVMSYDIVNAQGYSWQRVGYWSSAVGIQTFPDRVIVWPGGQIVTPKVKYAISITGFFAFDSSLVGSSVYAMANENQAAFRLACEQINADPILLKNAKLACKTVALNLDQNNNLALATAISNNTNAVVGDLFSSNTDTLASVFRPLKIPQITSGATAVKFSDRVNYPYLFRTVGSDLSQATALANAISFYGWKFVATLTVSDGYSEVITQQFASIAGANNITIVNSQTLTKAQVSTSTLMNQLNALQASGAFVFVLSAAAPEAAQIFQSAATLGLTGSDYAWILTDAAIAYPDGPVSNIANAPLDSMQGILAITPRSGFGPLFDILKANWKMKSPTAFPGKVHNARADGSTPDPGIFSAQTVDAVYSLSYAMDVTLPNFKPSDPAFADNVRSALFGIRFTGTTGDVFFNSNGDLAAPAYDLLNLQGSQFTRVGMIQSNQITVTQKVIFAGGRTTPIDSTPRRRYRIGGIFPSDPSLQYLGGDATDLYNVAAELESAFKIACEQVNAMGKIFPQARLDCLVEATTFDNSSVTNSTRQLLNQGVVGVVGCLSSSHSMLSSKILQTQNIPQISYGSTSSLLSDNTNYPNFFRTVTDSILHARALSSFVLNFGWKQLATIGAGDDDFYVDGLNILEANLRSNNIKLLGTERFTGDSEKARRTSISSSLKKLKDAGAAVFVVLVNPQDLILVMDEASNLNITGKGYTYLTTEALSFVSTTSSRLSPSVLQAMYGMVAVASRSGAGMLYNQFMNAWAMKDPDQYPGAIYSGSRIGSYVAPTFDAVLSFAYALNSQGNPFNLRNVLFNGTTGVVGFDANGDPLYPVFDILNLRVDHLDTVGSFVLGGNLTFNSPIVWPGNTLTVPSDQQPNDWPFPLSPKALRSVAAAAALSITLIVLCCIGSAVCVIVMVVRERRGNPVFRKFQERQ